jgi:hypothetical protein
VIGGVLIMKISKSNLKPSLKKISGTSQDLPILKIQLNEIAIFPYEFLFDQEFNKRLPRLYAEARGRTSNLLVKKCGIDIDNGQLNHTFYGCGPKIPCFSGLTEKGNEGMRRALSDPRLKPPQVYRGHPVITVIYMPFATFVDDPKRLGATVTFGTPSNYSIYIWLAKGALDKENPWILAHEIGHALQNRTFGSFPPHFPKRPFNLMFNPPPRVQDLNRVEITGAQIAQFRNSRLVFK